MLKKMYDDLSSGCENAKDGRTSDDGSDRPPKSERHFSTDLSMGRELRKVIYRPVQVQVLLCFTTGL